MPNISEPGNIPLILIITVTARRNWGDEIFADEIFAIFADDSFWLVEQLTDKLAELQYCDLINLNGGRFDKCSPPAPDIIC